MKRDLSEESTNTIVQWSRSTPLFLRFSRTAPVRRGLLVHHLL